MPATLVNSGTFNFNDGNAGHAITLGAPNAGETDVLCVNSNTVVTTPTGFALPVSRINSQGSYIYTRKSVGGEGATVTITTSGNHETAVGWTRWSGLNVKDDTANSGVDGVGGTSTPSHTTGTLAAATELIIAFAALHSLGAVPSSPVWAGSYTGQTAVTQGTGSTGVANYVGYKQPVGTAAESPSVSWTGTVSDRYMLTITFTVTGGLSATLGIASETDTAQALTRRKSRTLGIASTTDTAQAFTRRKTRLLGVAATTDTAGTLGRTKTRTLGVATTTDAAQALSRAKARLLGVAGETGTAGTLGRSKTRTLGVAGSTATAGALSHVRGATLGVAGDTSTAGHLGKVLGLGIAVEVDTARPITHAVVERTVRPTIAVVSGPQRATMVSGGYRVTMVSDA